MLNPGDLDERIAWEQLTEAPTISWCRATLATCTSIYHRFVEPGGGGYIPDEVFCDLPRWAFLEFLSRERSLCFAGAKEPNLKGLPHKILAANVHGWTRPRLFAFSEPFTPMFHALLDRRRFELQGRALTITIVAGGNDRTADRPNRFYFGVDYGALFDAPWTPGTVYLYHASDFPGRWRGLRYPETELRRVPPVARMRVAPLDWPFLNRVNGFDAVKRERRESSTFNGYPWPDDPQIHPLLAKRALVEPIRRKLEEKFDERLSLSALGGEIGASGFSLLRMFRAALGQSPHEYQTALRVEHARKLLKSGLSIAQTAAEAGFCDQSHLTRHFRRRLGLTPGQYLRLQ